MNKLGLEPISLIPFIFLLTFVGFTLVGGIGAYYGRGYEFRQVEAQLLADSVQKCVLENDVFASGFSLGQCGLDDEVIKTDHLVYVKKGTQEFFVGILDYKTQCYIEGAQKNPNYPKCVNFTIIKNNEQYYVITGSNQKAKRIGT